MRGKVILLLLYFPIFLPLLIFTQVPVLLKVLFSLNFLVLFIMTAVYIFKDKRYSPIFAAFIVFNFLFFIMAPMLQIHDVFESNNSKMVTKLIYKEYLMVKTSIFILIFNVVFFVAYQYFVSKKITFKPYKKDLIERYFRDFYDYSGPLSVDIEEATVAKVNSVFMRNTNDPEASCRELGLRME